MFEDVEVVVVVLEYVIVNVTCFDVDETTLGREFE